MCHISKRATPIMVELLIYCIYEKKCKLSFLLGQALEKKAQAEKWAEPHVQTVQTVSNFLIIFQLVLVYMVMLCSMSQWRDLLGLFVC